MDIYFQKEYNALYIRKQHLNGGMSIHYCRELDYNLCLNTVLAIIFINNSVTNYFTGRPYNVSSQNTS